MARIKQYILEQMREQLNRHHQCPTCKQFHDNTILGLIKNVSYGKDDRNRTSLMFTIMVSESGASSHWIWDKKAIRQIMRDVKATTTKQLVKNINGKLCWVYSYDHTHTFLRIAKLDTT